HAAPVATYYTFFKVGSRNERPGITGISHFHEHMMFNGAKKYGPKMFDLMLESNGGYSNAYTSNDVTAYYQDFTSSILDLIVDLESDRMASLAFDPTMVASEINVVREERRVSVDNDNTGILYEELFATAFKAHPYNWPVIGWMADLFNITRDDCVNYFKTYYAPNNATVVIVGDVDATKAIDMITKAFKEIPSGPPPATVVQSEPEQLGPRRSEIIKEAQFGHFMRGYHVGDKDSPDRFALEIMATILGSGESSRMNQTLVNDLQIAQYAYAAFELRIDPSLFYFYVAAVPGVGNDQTEQAVDSVLAAFIASGPTDEELTRAKNSLIAGYYKGYATNNGTAHQIGYYQTFYGDWRKMYEYPEGIRAVTTAQVKEAAAKYFTRNNSTTAVLTPQGGAL
ncbi:MAG: insulinase family protein, partial [candidate division Zixibacteria bacterium]|nr:insulinase family protein [candidate division Zixibacteria bacterium]